MDRRTRYQTYEDSTESVGAGYIPPGAQGPLVAQLRAPYRGQEVTIGGGALHLDQAVDAREIRMVQHEEDRIQVLPGFITELSHRRSAPRGTYWAPRWLIPPRSVDGRVDTAAVEVEREEIGRLHEGLR
ncbi:Os03g0373150 [Oryza sativa Japonica Group]|uniref:Os03g0373150 protein n=2 Tax=Oryza sativa subsp. japonica TaxID=39947 RepID=B9F8N1_ORYSJ|nr:hypothetical protein OsJ_11017 [Oryza sativa Japonica Group]BAS84382.1 Os03g0373150 [Oryza sativa Japonica Group]